MFLFYVISPACSISLSLPCVPVFVCVCMLTCVCVCVSPSRPQLSLRQQQVSEKLNEWWVFGEKYKELCEWLTAMESKVSHNGDVSIEEMIDKLRKVPRSHTFIQCLRFDWLRRVRTQV